MNVLFSCPPQEADGRGAGGGAAASQSADPAAAALRPAEVPAGRIRLLGPAVRPQLLPVRPAEPAAVGRGEGVAGPCTTLGDIDRSCIKKKTRTQLNHTICSFMSFWRTINYLKQKKHTSKTGRTDRIHGTS